MLCMLATAWNRRILLALLPVLLLSALQRPAVQALSIQSLVLSGHIALKETSLSPDCAGSVAHQCIAFLHFESNGSNLTLTPPISSQASCGIGQGMHLYCFPPPVESCLSVKAHKFTACSAAIRRHKLLSCRQGNKISSNWGLHAQH